MRQSTASPCLNDHGFTLLEVMIALSIMAGVVFTVIGSVNYHLSVVDRNRKESVAILLARQKLAELEDETDLPEKEKGTFAPAQPEYAWEMTSSKTELAQLKRIALAVTWDDNKRSVALVRYLAP